MKGPASCLPPVERRRSASPGCPPRTGRSTSRTLALDGKTVSGKTLDGSTLTAGKSYTLTGAGDASPTAGPPDRDGHAEVPILPQPVTGKLRGPGPGPGQAPGSTEAGAAFG